MQQNNSLKLQRCRLKSNSAYSNFEGNSYSLLDGNVRCLGTRPLYGGNCADGGLTNKCCRTLCSLNALCKFYALWNSGNCETYSECPSTSPDGNLTIKLWRKNGMQGDLYITKFEEHNHRLLFILLYLVQKLFV